MTINENDSGQKIVSMALWKGLSIVGATFLISVIGTAFAIAGVLNNDHFRLNALADKLDENTVEIRNKVDKEYVDMRLKNIDENVRQVSIKIDKILSLYLVK
jgi:hypothetical protein